MSDESPGRRSKSVNDDAGSLTTLDDRGMKKREVAMAQIRELELEVDAQEKTLNIMSGMFGICEMHEYYEKNGFTFSDHLQTDDSSASIRQASTEHFRLEAANDLELALEILGSTHKTCNLAKRKFEKMESHLETGLANHASAKSTLLPPASKKRKNNNKYDVVAASKDIYSDIRSAIKNYPTKESFDKQMVLDLFNENESLADNFVDKLRTVLLNTSLPPELNTLEQFVTDKVFFLVRHHPIIPVTGNGDGDGDGDDDGVRINVSEFKVILENRLASQRDELWEKFREHPIYSKLVLLMMIDYAAAPKPDFIQKKKEFNLDFYKTLASDYGVECSENDSAMKFLNNIRTKVANVAKNIANDNTPRDIAEKWIELNALGHSVQLQKSIIYLTEQAISVRNQWSKQEGCTFEICFGCFKERLEKCKTNFSLKRSMLIEEGALYLVRHTIQRIPKSISKKENTENSTIDYGRYYYLLKGCLPGNYSSTSTFTSADIEMCYAKDSKGKNASCIYSSDPDYFKNEKWKVPDNLIQTGCCHEESLEELRNISSQVTTKIKQALVKEAFEVIQNPP